MTADLLPLATRIEALDGPDREVDALILCALLASHGSKVEQSPINGAWCIYEPSSYGSQPFRLTESIPQRYRSTSLTTSIDAVVALITEKLPGVAWSVGRSDAKGEPWGKIRVAPLHNIQADAATPALALLAAFLRALASQENRK